jgi:hypothetical protein
MRSWVFLSCAIGFAGIADAADSVDYERDIKPLLSHKCGACHGALKQQAGLRLDSGALIRKGSDDGPVIVPGKAVESLLIEKVTSEDVDERMPPEGEGEPLNAEQIALLSAWINAGAKFPDGETVPADPRDHWAYQVAVRPPLPEVDDRSWSHPVDAFIRREHQRLGLKAVDVADRHTLLRRVYLDLIGLPPTRQQIQSFIEDDSPDAWARVVNDLLESPHYGERWGRHWMDVWRYSDWDGYKQQLRGSQRHIWRWRDWIVQSLNEDKGYDRMIVEMLAADELAPDDPSILSATGFLARNFHKSNRNIWLDAAVEHTAKAFLGLTINCARCHDHKYDPVPQTAYYQFRAIFEPHKVRTDRIPGQPDIMKDGLPRAFDADLEVATFVYLAGNDKHPDKDHPMTAAVPEVLGGRFEVQPVKLPVAAFYPGLQDFVVEEQLAAARKELTDAEQALAERDSALAQLKATVAQLRLQSIEARLVADRAKHADADQKVDEGQLQELALAAAKAERQFNARQAGLTVEQKKAALQTAKSSKEKDAKKKQAAVAKTKKELADAEKNLKTVQEAAKKTDGAYTPLGTEYPRTSSGRRLALARWIATSENPLTARVAVNHIWMRHFGSPLVDNVFDFGLRSPRPRHAELLDFLAVELMENGWSMKHLHRLIVTSRTWQLASSQGQAANLSAKLDQDNDYLWRMNARRLDAEIIRDNVLAISGQLEKTLGGTDIDFRQGEESRRRSIYLRHAYEKQMTMLVLFDAASPNECYRRSESIVPQQALALTNSSLSLGQSRLLARELWENSKGGKDPQTGFVESVFLQVLSRPPEQEELTACVQFLVDQAKTLSDTSKLTTFAGGNAPKVKPATDPPARARENLVHVLMNHNDFVTVR